MDGDACRESWPPLARTPGRTWSTQWDPERTGVDDRKLKNGALDLHKNFFAFDTYRINCNSFLRVRSGPGGCIEGPGMPGANHFALFDQPLGQRPAPVGTFVVQRPDYPIDVGDA
jgi:hypothetical protein